MAESRMSTINGYQKIKKVGEGAFGKTYHVTKDGQDYALKMLKSFQTTEAVLIATMKEIRILSSLDHANVVSYVESFRDGLNKLYILMEYCEYGNLGMLIDTPDPRVAEEIFIVGVMTQLCCGLEYIHSKKVIHRDIKPTNIFIQRGGSIKIGDFGLSKILQSSGYANTICGTASYISPECLQGLPYKYQSDMWAIGRVLFDLCNRGVKIWHPASITIPPRYSNDLRTILQKLLSPDPRHRLPAADAMTMFSNINSTSSSSLGGTSAEPAIDPGAVLTEPAIDPGAVLTEPAIDPGAVLTEPAIDPGAVLTEPAIDPGAVLTEPAIDPDAVLTAIITSMGIAILALI